MDLMLTDTMATVAVGIAVGFTAGAIKDGVMTLARRWMA